jgi:DIS3-like exonuclease 1
MTPSDAPPARRARGVASRESYARSDVACGSAECDAHRELNARCGRANALARAEDGAKMYVIPDARAWELYGEVFASGHVNDVIALRSTTRRLGKRRASTSGARARWRGTMQRAFDDRRRRLFAFDDEHCAEMARWARELGAGASRETAAAAYYASKVEGKFPIVVVSDDQAASMRDNTPRGVVVVSVDAFVERFCADEEDAAARRAFEAARAVVEEARAPSTSGAAYEPHLSESDLLAGVGDGSLTRGTLRVKALGTTCEGYVGDVFVSSKRAMNRAMHGDVVAVQILPEDEWCAPNINTVMEEERNVREGDVSTSESTPRTRTGKIVGILQRATRDIVACLDAADEEEIARNPHATRNGALCAPMDGKMVKVKLLTRRAHELVGARFVVRVDRWQTNQRYPCGHLIKVLGAVGDVDCEMAALLARYDIPADAFGAQSLAELPREGENWVVPPDELTRRRDLRHHRACSIDPPGCTDVDDALSVHFLDERGSDGAVVEVGVHIADVSYFVRPGTLLDYEARLRGTTVYLVDRRLDMLPSLLSENLASLLQRRDRLAVSCVWRLDEKMDVVDVWFGRSVIHSRHQMTYYQAQAIHDEKPLPLEDGAAANAFPDARDIEVVRKDLQTLVAFANKANAVRLEHGAVELESAELRFETDARTKSPTEVIKKAEVPMMRVVAELMILANSAAARVTHRAFPSNALLRRHAPPREGGFAELTKLAAAKGVELDCSSGEALSASLARIAVSSDAEVTTLFRGLATRAMSEAQYVSSGSVSDTDGGFGHYGLALTYYTHFTSPIRRYADVVVHRQLIEAAEAAGDAASSRGFKSMSPELLESLATHLNERNRASKLAQSRCGEIYLLWLLREKPAVEAAVVHEIRDDGVMVFLPSFHIKAPVRLVDEDNGCAIKELTESEFEPDPSSSNWIRAKRSVGVDGFAARRSTSPDEDRLDIVRVDDDSVVRSYALLDKVWVQLSCKHTRAYGPRLELRLLNAETHAGARAAAASRAPARPAASSLSNAMREVIKTRVTRTPIGTADDDDDDDGDDDARAVENLNVVPAASPSRARRDASLAPLTRLVLNDDVAVTVDDSPIHGLRITKQTRDRRPGDRLARRLAAAAWARLAATRAAGEAGRARYEKRRRRVDDALARVRVAKDDE